MKDWQSQAHVKWECKHHVVNGHTYLDALNKKAVREFINVTHEGYRSRFGEYFGNVIPGIFTDEPFRGALFRDFDIWGIRTAIPWTEGLSKFFDRSFGYNLTDYMPELFYDLSSGQYPSIEACGHWVWLMIRIAEKLGFMKGTLVEVRQRNDNQWSNLCFGYYYGRNSLKMKLERLSFRDRFGILSEKRLRGVAGLKYIRLYGVLVLMRGKVCLRIAG